MTNERAIEKIRKETAQEIFSWLWRNMVNLNFITGNVEVNFVSLQNFAKTYGIELLYDLSSWGGQHD